MDNMQDLMIGLTDSVKSAHSKISDNVNKLTEVSTRVDQNKNNIEHTVLRTAKAHRLPTALAALLS